jgi:hypothetical protein
VKWSFDERDNFDLEWIRHYATRLQWQSGVLRLSDKYTDSDLLVFLSCQEQPWTCQQIKEQARISGQANNAQTLPNDEFDTHTKLGFWSSKSGGLIDTHVHYEVVEAKSSTKQNPPYSWWLQHVFIHGKQPGGVGEGGV